MGRPDFEKDVFVHQLIAVDGSRFKTAREAALRIWTSPSKDGFGKEYCSVLNEVLRRDEPGDALAAAVDLVRTMNRLLVAYHDPGVLRD